MSGRPWYAFHVKRYERKTAHLTLMQDGAYRRMLDHYYDNESPLPANMDALHRIVRCQSTAEKQAVSVVLAQFFHLEADGWHNDTADEELQRASEVSAKRAQNGSKGGSKRQANARANARAKHEQTGLENDQQNTGNGEALANTYTVTVTETEKEKEKNPKKETARSRSLLNGSEADFQTFYDIFPLHKSRRAAEKAFVSALKRAPPAQIIAGAQRYRDDPNRKPEYTRYPATWLNSDGWLDEPVAAAQPAAESPADKLYARLKKEADNGPTV